MAGPGTNVPSGLMVVAIGGSAGALAAVRGLIAGLPAQSGIAYILVQHLDPEHPSLLADLLAAATPFPVIEVTDGMALLPDRLHVIPSGGRIMVAGGVLRLLPATHGQGPRLPVDYLLQSLAVAPGMKIVAVLLSGHGSDGSEGAQAVHRAGGYVIAQDPAEAGHDSMPASAIATGCVDAILPVAAIGPAIIDLRNRWQQPVPAMGTSEWIAPVLARLRACGHDFSDYKPGTLKRRLERRARLANHASGTSAQALAAYVDRLAVDDQEVKALANDLLINVTSFFRDPEVFDTLARKILPDLVRRHDGNRPLRVWSAGCSSGEEAWSLAMLLLEEIGRSRPQLKLQLFATDLDPDAIAIARRGVYAESIDQQVSPDRIRRFFVPDDDGWRVGQALQASVVFAVHDLLADPPFSRIDMIACRNLLIYLQPAAQARAFGLFHFALRPGGLLLLGTAEAVTEPADSKVPSFTLVSRQAHLYRRGTNQRPPPKLALTAPLWAEARSAPQPGRPVPSLPGARLQALEAELASIRAQLADDDRHSGDPDFEQAAAHADALQRAVDDRSANEELITSQEELQSLNEELVALNGQLQETIDRQRTMSDDLQNILNSTNIATIFLDHDNHIRFFTPATRALFNMLPSDVGRPFADLAPITPDPLLAEDIATLRSGSQPPEREILAADGICFSRRVLPYRAHDNQTQGVIITYTDVTERIRAERVMREAREAADTANLAKTRFLAAASHDLRQPLQSLVLLHELLAHRTTDPESQQLLARLDRTLGSMAAMLDGMLDINRIEAGAVQVALEQFPLDPLMADIVQSLALEASACRLALRHVPSGLHVVSDRRLLAGMVRNLVANALKYTLQGGVLLGARRRGNMVTIEVWDTGIGIAADKREMIFEPYRQLGPTAVDRSRGLGLGLAIVRSLGDMLGHSVDVRSRRRDAPGEGSVFSITVPMAPASTTVAGPPRADALPPPDDRPVSGEVIMLVDDDADMLDLLGHLLRDAGNRVLTARTADEALALLKGQCPDLVISDFRLDGPRDGLEVAQDLRAAVRLLHDRSLPVIVLTGDVSIDALVRFAANDIIRLTKPVRLAELHKAIAVALGHQQRQIVPPPDGLPA